MACKGLMLLCLITCAAAFAHAVPDDTPEANPARPTVSTPATLPPVGYLQFETGVVDAFHSPEFSSQHGLSQVTKIAVHPRLELLMQSSPLAYSRAAARSTQAGDVLLGFQGVVFPGHGAHPTVSLSYLGRVREGGSPDLDIGSAQHSGILLVSADAAGFHLDANGLVNVMSGAAVRRAQYGQTLSISRRAGKFTISGELWHFSQPFANSSAAGNLWAVSYAWRKNWVFDVGFDHGLTGTSTRWEALWGFTYLLPHRLW